tara:strand:- start:60 stop:719 length:660 start_codon:yes stop_codon:yes gene_type:complete
VHRILILIFLFFNTFGFSQEDFQKYREDQIYFSVYYNSLGSELDDFKENKFSNSFNFGFIRDIPISKSGKFALGLGVGFGTNSFNNNMKLFSNNQSLYELLSNRDTPTKNTFNFSEIQFPLEIRWRNSSPSNYKFWRIYAGLKYSKVLQSSFKHDSSQENYKLSRLPINLDQLGFTLNIGYNTWNIGLYKSLRPFFNKKIESLPQGLEQFKVGLIFYIL